MKEQSTDSTHAILYHYLEKIRPSEEIRPQFDLGYTYEKGLIELFTIRPDWMDETVIRHFPYARIRFVKSRNLWKLYWHRASGAWNEYSVFPESPDLQALLDHIQKDPKGCFFG